MCSVLQQSFLSAEDPGKKNIDLTQGNSISSRRARHTRSRKVGTVIRYWSIRELALQFSDNSISFLVYLFSLLRKIQPSPFVSLGSND